jgi:hypothetical protein
VPDIFHSLFYKVRPEKISLFRFLLEGYDGLAVLSTLDASDGLVRLLVPESRMSELGQFLEAVSEELYISDVEISLDKPYE